MEKVFISRQQHPFYNAAAALMLAKDPLPCQSVRNRLVRMEWCAVMLQGSTPPWVHETTKRT